MIAFIYFLRALSLQESIGPLKRPPSERLSHETRRPVPALYLQASVAVRRCRQQRFRFSSSKPEGVSMSKSIAAIFAFLTLTTTPLIPALHAQSTPPAPAASTAATWKINCPGVRNVPMTADAQQSLPLQVIAILKCGEEVTVLANDEGYTVRIKSSDGTVGYVAAMYLKKVPAPSRAPKPPSANIENGVARWHQGAPGCDDFISNGILVESLTVAGVTVQVSLHDTGWKLRANVAIANSGSEAVRIEPSQFILDDVGVNGKPLFYQDPAKLAKNVTHQILWTEAVAEPENSAPRTAASAQTLSATTVGYRSSFTPSVSAPNYILQHQYAEENAVRQQGKQTLNSTAKQILALALKPATIEPNDKVSGAVWFERDKDPQQLMLRIPIENQTFEFPLSFKQQK